MKSVLRQTTLFAHAFIPFFEEVAPTKLKAEALSLSDQLQIFRQCIVYKYDKLNLNSSLMPIVKSKTQVALLNDKCAVATRAVGDLS